MKVLALFRRWRRMATASIRFLLRLPRSIHPMEWAIQAFSFPQHDWAKRLRRDLSRDEFEITWQQAVNPVYWIAWAFRFFVRWVATRPYSSLAPAIPAFLVATVLVAVVVVSHRKQGAEVQAIYLKTLRTSLRSGDMNVAAVAAQRLISIDPANLEHQYQLALLDDQLGKSETAKATILSLALQHEYGPAALWTLKSILYEDYVSDTEDLDASSVNGLVRRTEWSKSEEQICHRCATVAMTKLPSQRSLFAKRMYAAFLAENGFTGDALRLYKAIAEFDSSVNLTAAQLAAQTGDFLTSKSFAKDAVRYLEPKLLSNPTSVKARLDFAQAMILDERDDEALALLRDGMKIQPDSLFSMAAAEALIFKSYRMGRSIGKDETLIDRAQLMIEAIKLAPNSPLVVEAVVQLAIECHAADDQKMERVRKALLEGMTPAAMHFVEGTVLLMAGDEEAAIHHLELAAQEGGNMAGLLNNLAVALSASGTVHLAQALRFSDEALRQLPGHPYLHETRGQIYLRLERYHDAIADLEKALPDPRMRPLAHAGLAQAYRALGVTDLAEQHQKLAGSDRRSDSK